MLKKILFYSVIFYILFGFIAVPLILKSQLVSVVEEQTNAKLEIDTLYFNPLMFRLEVQGLMLSSLDDKELLKTKRIILNVELYSLFNSAIHVKELFIEEPEVFLALSKEKEINFSSLVKESTEEVEETNSTTEIPRIILDKIALINGSVNYEDYSQKSKFEFRVDTLGFELKDIDTKDMNTSDANLRVYMKLEDGGFFDLKSEIVALEPMVVKGSLDYEASKLYSQWRYVKDSLNLEVANGRLSLHADYHLDMADLEAMSLSNVRVKLDALRIKPKGNYKDILTLESLAVENASIKPLAQDVHIPKIALNALDVKVKRDKNRDIDWLEYIKVNTDSPTKEQETEVETTDEAKPWKVLVDAVSLENIKVDFDDKGVFPNVQSTLNTLNVYAQDITLDGASPLKYQMNLLFNDEFKCNSKGSVVHKILDAKTSIKCSNFDVEHYVPYIDEIAKKELETYNVKLRSLKTSFSANVDVKDVNSSIGVNVSDGNVLLSDFALNKRSTNKRLMTFSDFNVSGLDVDTLAKEVVVDKTTLSYLNIRTKRLKDGSLSLENLIVPREAKPSKTDVKEESSNEKEYRVRLNKVALKGAKVSFEDQSLSPIFKTKVDWIYLNANGIDSKKNSWMNYYLSARVNSSGKIKSSGSVRHTPLKQRGKISLDKLSLKEITPYLQESLFVSLDDGRVSFDAKTQYSPSKNSADLNVDGSFKIEEFFLSDSRDKSSLLSFNKLGLQEFTLETNPNRFFVNEVDVDSFYVHAAIDENKVMNFGTLLKNADVNSTDENSSEVATTSDINETTETADAFPIRIAKININNGNAIFSDASLPLKFKTDIHDLHGAIYAVSSNPDETSYIDIVGDIDKYGSTKLKGSVNASDPTTFTDLDFNFRNLDLSAMSGYSRTFAGHHIDNGKLFLNLNYDIQDSELKGENSIIVKKIKLGEEVDIEGGSLPLGFVIALLEDDEGIMDIDMPIRGNVDEPDFKYGALVWKTFGNLILKAVASPFKFLGSMLGIGGDELEYAEFESGGSNILPSEREKLDNVAKLLVKRPKIMLSISGSYNTAKDKEALQKEKLIALVVKESGAKNEEERVSAMTIDLLEDIYEDAKDDDKLDAVQERLEKEYKDDAFDRAYLQELVRLCSELQVVSLTDLQALAKKRSLVLKSYLVDDKGIDMSRVKELEFIEVQSAEEELIRSKLEVIIK